VSGEQRVARKDELACKSSPRGRGCPPERMRDFFQSFRFRSIALAFASAYVSAAVLSVSIAHVLLIAKPASGLGERVIMPLAKGLDFLDAHWKAVLMVVFPFVAPLARDLVPRLRKAWGLEFDSIPLRPVEMREKPTRSSP